MLYIIQQRTKGCCNIIITARQTINDGEPAYHPLARRAQARVLAYLERFREHLYDSPLIDEDARVAQAALVAEGALRICANCPLRNPSITNPGIPCETVKAFSDAPAEEDFFDGATC
jgi:hypothetical protein